MMRIIRLIPLSLLLLSTHLSATDLEKIKTQQRQLKEDTHLIHERTQADQARLDELTRLLAAQRAKSRLLDQQLRTAGAQKQPTEPSTEEKKSESANSSSATKGYPQ